MFIAVEHAATQSAEPLSKRAPSTTRTSLRFRINHLRAVWNSVAQNPRSRISDLRCRVAPIVYRHAHRDANVNCVRPINLARSLTGFSSRSAARAACSHRALTTSRTLFRILNIVVMRTQPEEETDGDRAATLHLVIALGRAMQAIERGVQPHLRESGLGLTEFGVLEVLYHKGPL